MVVTEEVHSLIEDIVYENGFTRFDKGRWSSLLAFHSEIPFNREILQQIVPGNSGWPRTVQNGMLKFYNKLLNGEMDGINSYIKSIFPDSITEVFNAVVKLSPETQIKLLPLFYEYTPEFLSEDMVSNAITNAENTSVSTSAPVETEEIFDLAEEEVEVEIEEPFDLSNETAEERLINLLHEKMYHPGYRTYAKKMVNDSLSESKPLQAGRCTIQRPNQCAKITPGARRNVLRQVLQLEEEGQITEAQADLFIKNLALPESL